MVRNAKPPMMISGMNFISTNLPPTEIRASRVNQLSKAKPAYNNRATRYFLFNELPGSTILKLTQG